jgi:hypothetical protein
MGKRTAPKKRKTGQKPNLTIVGSMGGFGPKESSGRKNTPYTINPSTETMKNALKKFLARV